ncbi:hypothetical protein HanIR_Chr11g0536941 [Helianthus annuus]|nr:hypothetical protein HanIR_Chr11g0536941 [Helianthus annuus]
MLVAIEKVEHEFIHLFRELLRKKMRTMRDIYCLLVRHILLHLSTPYVFTHSRNL